MQIENLSTKVLVLLSKLDEDLVPLVLAILVEFPRGLDVQPLSPPSDLVFTTARRILFLGQWLESSPTEETPQRTEATTCASQKLIHTQLGKSTVVDVAVETILFVVLVQAQAVVILAGNVAVCRRLRERQSHSSG